ncbi:phytoene desaturase family protein [Ruegeria marina]|uniref:Phytoene dehydrogenase-related protein n=1 Tax=Ruegeria marina TaxID=639004 RepID=A0A1G6WYC7_9RHOB|nr:NAD(P)/FAD-dependent oxidoreductase [Ruegeria marina]SDD70663.1 Phytoene dehydrogenase-related protein [Ruegeria marina]
MTYDAIVIGAGHNGLTAAATLARKGARVCVVEKNAKPGGMALSGTLDGVEMPRMAHLVYNLNPRVLSELGLSNVNLKPLKTVSLSPDGNHVVLDGNRATRVDGTPHPEATAYAARYDDLKRFSALLAPLAERSAPGVSFGGRKLDKFSELMAAARIGLKLKLLGRRNMREFLRILLSNVHDYTLDELSDGPIAGAMAADAVKGSWSGPRSPGSVLSLMYRMSGSGPAHVMGGIGKLTEALAEAAQSQAAEIRSGAGVARIFVAEDRAVGVLLDDGSELRARTVLSSIGALQSLKLAGVEHFDAETVTRLRNIRTKGTAAKINLVLGGVPTFSGLPSDLLGARIVIAPGSTYVEHAFNPAKYGEMSEAPVLEIVMPGQIEPGTTQPDRHGMSILFHYAPHDLEGGWTDAAHARLLDITLATLDAYAPGLRQLVVASEVLSPARIEAETGAPGGHWHHGEWSTDQMLTTRPASGLAHYRFAVRGLYLCGAATHPGGDVTGLPGRNAALQLLKDGACA